MNPLPGTALPSLISSLSAAHSATITDHPSSPALVADTIAHNVHHNLKINLLAAGSASESEPKTNTAISIHGLTWGDPLFTSPTTYGKPSSPQPAKHSFDKIIVADCLWMPSQHANLVKTIDSCLAAQAQQDEAQANAASMPCALVIAGFHTGRSTLARFFKIATGSSTLSLTASVPDRTQTADLDSPSDEDEDEDEELKTLSTHASLRAAELFEIDVDRNVRPWQPSRAGEDKHAAKRWCVVGVLVRR